MHRVGNVYIADQGNQRVRKVTISTGIITTIAGTGSSGYSGDDGQATAATFNNPFGVTQIQQVYLFFFQFVFFT